MRIAEPRKKYLVLWRPRRPAQDPRRPRGEMFPVRLCRTLLGHRCLSTSTFLSLCSRPPLHPPAKKLGFLVGNPRFWYEELLNISSAPFPASQIPPQTHTMRLPLPARDHLTSSLGGAAAASVAGGAAVAQKTNIWAFSFWGVAVVWWRFLAVAVRCICRLEGFPFMAVVWSASTLGLLFYSGRPCGSTWVCLNEMLFWLDSF